MIYVSFPRCIVYGTILHSLCGKCLLPTFVDHLKIDELFQVSEVVEQPADSTLLSAFRELLGMGFSCWDSRWNRAAPEDVRELLKLALPTYFLRSQSCLNNWVLLHDSTVDSTCQKFHMLLFDKLWYWRLFSI